MGIMNRGGALYMATGIDNSGLNRGFDDAEKRIEQFRAYAEKAGLAIGGYFGIQGISGFVKQMVNVRSEFQNTEAMFKVFLGNGDKAKSFMKEMQGYAFNNVFEFKDLTQQAAQLLAFGTEVHNVTSVIDKLSNVAAGVNQPLERFVELYNKAKSRNKLDATDVQQWSAMGDVIGYLAEMLGKSTDETRKLVTEGNIGFKEMDQLLTNLTSTGGKFHGMMEEKMKTLGDSVGLLQDTITSVFNELGEKSEDYLRGGILLTNDLVENYEKIGRILAGIIATYGAYRAAIVLTTIATNGLTLAESLWYAKSEMILKIQKLINATMLKNPYVLAATLIMGIVAAMWAFYQVTDIEAEAQERLNKHLEDAKNRKEALASETNNLVSVINSETATILQQVKAYEDLQNKYKEYIAGMTLAEFKAMSLAEQQKLLNKAMDEIEMQDQTSSVLKKQQEIVDIEAKITDLKKNIKDYTSPEVLRAISYKVEQEEKSLNIAKKDLDNLKKVSSEMERQQKLAEFEALSDDEKTKRIKNHLSILEQEKIEVQALIDSSQNLGTPFELLDYVLQSNLERLKLIVDKVNELNGKLPKDDISKNKSYWEKQKKEAETYLDGLDSRKKKLLDNGKYTGFSAEDVKAYKEAVNKQEEAMKNLKLYNHKDTTSKDESAAQKRLESLRKLDEDDRKRQLEKQRFDIDMQQESINLMADGIDKQTKQANLNFEKAKLDISERQNEYLKQQQERLKTKYESEKGTDKGFEVYFKKLSSEDIEKQMPKGLRAEDIADSIKQLTDAAQKSQIEALEEVNRAELQHMRDYIQEYGTFQQKKLAIAQGYDQKIADSQSEWEKASLEKQKQSAIKGVDIEAITKNIDWQVVFGNMTGVLESQLKETLSTLKDYIKTDEFKGSSETDKKIIYEAIDKLREVLPGGEGTLNFKEIKRQMNELGAAVNKLQIAKTNEIEATNNLERAQNAHKKAVDIGNKAIIESAEASLAVAKAHSDEAIRALDDAESNAKILGDKFKETSTDTVDGLNLVADGFHNFASNSLPQIFKGFQDTITGLSKLNIGGKVGEIVDTLAESLGNIGQELAIIGAILSILDILKDGIGTLISSLIDTVLNAVDGILSDILSGDIVIKIGNSLKNGISNILNTISFGGFGSLIGSLGGGNAKETAEVINSLTLSNKALKVSVDALKNEMAGSNGVKSIQAYQKAVDAQKRYNDNLQGILNAQMKYSSSHHSNSYYWDLNKNSLKEVNKLLGTNLRNSWSDFSDLSAEQMNEIRKNLPDVWSEMNNQGKYGSRFEDDWNNYADQAGKAEELTKALHESITQISFDSLRDSFVNALMDMDSDAQDFANSFEEYMMRSLLNFAIGDLLDEKMRSWYTNWAQTMEDQGGVLYEKQLEQYRKEYDEFAQMGIDKRNEIAELTGYTGKDSSQQASKGFSKSMSQDTGDAIVGRVTGIQMVLLEMLGYVSQIAGGEYMSTPIPFPEAKEPSKENKPEEVEKTDKLEHLDEMFRLSEEMRNKVKDLFDDLKENKTLGAQNPNDILKSFSSEINSLLPQINNSSKSEIENILNMDKERNAFLKGFAFNFSELRDIQLQAMWYLEDIAGFTKVLPSMAEAIEVIKQNTR